MMPKCAHEHSSHALLRIPVRLTRCFVPGPLSGGATTVLPAGPSAHLGKVLRLRAGADLTLFDGRGGEYPAQILALARDGVHVSIGEHDPIEREAPVAVTLLQCLARGERMDWIVQKATELGVARIVPVSSEHCVVRLDESSAQRRQPHWQAVAISACEQCGRNRPPDIQAPVTLERACAQWASSGAVAQPRLVLDPAGQRSLASALTAPSVAAPPSLTLLVGPEGGLSARELALAQHHGFLACRLGPRILRAETAPLAALATVQALLGDLGDR
jgi:16S rRNA (uracil1498-N3)-methyltransferase